MTIIYKWLGILFDFYYRYVLVTQSCPTLCDPMDPSLPGFSVCGILQARILEWVALSFSKASSQPRNKTQVSCIAGRFFINWAKFTNGRNLTVLTSYDTSRILNSKVQSVNGSSFKAAVNQKVSKALGIEYHLHCS